MDAIWLEMAKSSGIRMNPVRHIKPQKLTHVSCVRVCAPPDRKIDDPVCSISGEVSFQVGRYCTTFFRRGKDDPDRIDLMGDDSYLTFSDIHGSARALPPVSPTDFLHVKMDLTEITTSGEHVEIAKIDACWEPNGEDASGMELGKCFVLHGKLGFKFEVCYSVMFGACVEVGASILEQGDEDSFMACQLFAYHYSLKDPNEEPPGKGLLPQTRALLKFVYADEPLTVKAWTDIDLDRKFVVAPIREGQFLSIHLAIAMNDEEFYKYYDVDFPLMQLWDEKTDSLWASKDMTHIKHLWLPSLTKFALSITFLPDVLEEDAQLHVKHDIESAPTSLERPCFMERECELDDDGGSSNLTPKVALTPSKRPYSLVHKEHGDGGELN